MINWVGLAQVQVRMKTKFLSVDYDYIINIVKKEMPRLEKAVKVIMDNEFPGYMVREKGGLKLP